MPHTQTQLIEKLESMSPPSKHSKIQLSTLLPPEKRTWPWRALAQLGDRIMGLHLLQRLYDDAQLAGLDRHSFVGKLFAALGLTVTGADQVRHQLPASGPVIIVSNHPFGCIEGIAIADLVSKLRPDTKVLANKALGMFEEIKPHFIFINPLNPGDAANLSAIRQCRQHLVSGGVLVVFPAGKVSYWQPEKQRVCDAEWNRLPAQLAKSLNCPVLPLFVEGQNSPWFINLGRVYYRFKILLLFREMLKAKGREIQVKTGRVLSPAVMSKFKSLTAVTDFLRVQSYLRQGAYQQTWPEDEKKLVKPLMAPVRSELLAQETAALPKSQHLADYKSFSVYYGYQQQMPNVVLEIARLRELVFREHNEGSGEELDTDEFDASYTHLFIVNRNDDRIIGAYRMGQTDRLLEAKGLDGLYLSRMFEFDEHFVNRTEPCLEMGRSFIVPEHQRSFYGLFLLWRGIGEFVVRHPQYRTLYGTVSISKLYSPISVDCISALSLRPNSAVRAKTPFTHPRHPELGEFIERQAAQPNLLSLLVQGIETDGKDVPILMKQYEKLAARFYCIGIDKNFNHTPGLLLSVSLAEAPTRALKQYLGDGLESYLNFTSKTQG